MSRDYQMNCPISLNRFILIHIQHINGATKLGQTTIKKLKKQNSMINNKSTKILSQAVSQKLTVKKGLRVETSVNIDILLLSHTFSPFFYC